MKAVILALVTLTPAFAAEQQSVQEFFSSFAQQRDAIDSFRAPFVQRTVTPDEITVPETLTPAFAAEQQSVQEFFSSFAQQRDAIDSFRAPFVQRTVTPDGTTVSEGIIVYARPKRLLFRYEDPPLVYMLDGLNAYEYDAELEQLQIFELEDRPESEAYFLGFENSVERLQEAYNIQMLPPDDPATSELAVTFRPKDPEDEESFFETVTMQLRKGDLLPTKIQIVNDAESSTEFMISNFAVNEATDPEERVIVLPEDTVIVENDRYVETVGPEGKRVPSEAP